MARVVNQRRGLWDNPPRTNHPAARGESFMAPKALAMAAPAHCPVWRRSWAVDEVKGSDGEINNIYKMNK